MPFSAAVSAMYHAVINPSFLYLLQQQKEQLYCPSLNFKKTATLTRVLLFLQLMHNCWALTCMTCAAINHQYAATQLDKFRVTTQLPQPSCFMEPIQCDRDQDICVTITMYIRGGHYWVGAGCDRHEHFQHTTCENVHIATRNVQLGIIHERRAVQRVCVCTFDKCNRAQSNVIYFDERPYMNILIYSLILRFYNNMT